MKPTLTFILPLLALLVALPCQADSKKTEVRGNHLENTFVGFYGFAVDVPLDYRPYAPPTDKKFEPKTYPDLAWYLASRIDRHAGCHTIEVLPFQYRNRGLVVVVTATDMSIPPVKREKEHLRVLDIFMSWLVKRTRDEFLRGIRTIGDLQVGRVATQKEGTVTAANFVLLPPATILTFYGACPEAEKDDLLADLDAAVATLNIGKRVRF